MTLLLAEQATDGLAALSDRKETCQRGQSRDVQRHLLDKREKYYVSLAGYGKLVKEVLRGPARAKTGPVGALPGYGALPKVCTLGREGLGA